MMIPLERRKKMEIHVEHIIDSYSFFDLRFDVRRSGTSFGGDFLLSLDVLFFDTVAFLLVELTSIRILSRLIAR